MRVLPCHANRPDVRDACRLAQACCALTGEGLYEGLDWIIHSLRQK